jgi:hypothetical protein
MTVGPSSCGGARSGIGILTGAGVPHVVFVEIPSTKPEGMDTPSGAPTAVNARIGESGM